MKWVCVQCEAGYETEAESIECCECANCIGYKKRITELEADQKEVNAAFHQQGWNDCKASYDKRIAELELKLELWNQESVEHELIARLRVAEAQVDAVRRYSNKCAILRTEPTTAGLKKALQGQSHD